MIIQNLEGLIHIFFRLSLTPLRITVAQQHTILVDIISLLRMFRGVFYIFKWPRNNFPDSGEFQKGHRDQTSFVKFGRAF